MGAAMGRPVPCTIGLHAWQTVDYDQHSDQVSLECRKCGKRRQRSGTSARPDRPEQPPGNEFR